MARWPVGYQRKTRPRTPRVFAVVPDEFRMGAAEVAPIVEMSVTQLIDLTSRHPAHRPKGLDLPWPEHIGRGAWAWDRRAVDAWKNGRSHERTPPCLTP
jgi:predicted DNA-binding transcriptional regulator AlpA